MDLSPLFSDIDSHLFLDHGRRGNIQSGEVLGVVDSFEGADCLFLRAASTTKFHLEGDYRLQRCAAGGWLLHSRDVSAPSYWMPVDAILRRVSKQGHILEEQAANLDGFALDTTRVTITLSSIPEQWTLDVVIWRLTDPALIDELLTLAPIETQGYFSWGSHTCYRRPADIFAHLIHGYIYERRFSWPFKRRICSENDAHALHVMLDGLRKSTGKRFYQYLADQILLSTLARQSPDGGYRHGEWTEEMEAHFRLNASAMHLFLDVLQTGMEPAVMAAAVRLAGYLAETRDETAVGVWFLHDDLERSEEAMNRGPFKWAPNRVLGKSPSNMLVINTHMDTSVALDRYARVCGDTRYQPLVESGRAATRAVIELKPAEWLYRPLFKAISLTMLPTAQAQLLPLPVRALKRIAWKYLIPNLYRIKRLFPRLVMPGGYFDRHLALDSFAFHYLPINLMDLVRYRRRLSVAGVDELIANAARFIQESGVRGRWRELAYERYALGFWAEALWQLCQTFDDWRYRVWLAEAVLDLEDEEMGIPPSLLGGNREALARPLACPSPPDPAVRVLSIQREDVWEMLWVNTSATPVAAPVWTAREWRDASGNPIAPPTQLPARQFVAARRLLSSET